MAKIEVCKLWLTCGMEWDRIIATEGISDETMKFTFISGKVLTVRSEFIKCILKYTIEDDRDDNVNNKTNGYSPSNI